MTEQFGLALRALREEAGLTLVELARQSGIARSHLYRLEQGETSQPSIETLVALAEPFARTPEQIYELAWQTTGYGPELPSFSTFLNLKYGLNQQQINVLVKSFRKQTGTAPGLETTKQPEAVEP